jgi:predicted DNA-binding transcriptional regulator AlpA
VEPADIAVTRIGIADLAARLGVDRSTIWRWYQSGKFPPPHYLGERRTWLLSEVEKWERERMARSTESRPSARNAERLHAKQPSR